MKVPAFKARLRTSGGWLRCISAWTTVDDRQNQLSTSFWPLNTLESTRRAHSNLLANLNEVRRGTRAESRHVEEMFTFTSRQDTPHSYASVGPSVSLPSIFLVDYQRNTSTIRILQRVYIVNYSILVSLPCFSVLGVFPSTEIRGLHSRCFEQANAPITKAMTLLERPASLQHARREETRCKRAGGTKTLQLHPPSPRRHCQ